MMSNEKEISKETVLKIALAIIDLFICNGCWFDTWIYILDYVFSSYGVYNERTPDYVYSRKVGEKTGKIYVFSGIRAKDYFKHCGDYISIAIEGNPVDYVIVNHTFHEKVSQILEPYGLFFEAGAHGYFYACPID